MLPSHQINRTNLPELGDLDLADNNFHIPAKVDILLGVDLFYHLVRPGNVKHLPGCIVVETEVGWAVTGPVVHAAAHKTRMMTNSAPNRKKTNDPHRYCQSVPDEGKSEKMANEALQVERYPPNTTKQEYSRAADTADVLVDPLVENGNSDDEVISPQEKISWRQNSTASDRASGTEIAKLKLHVYCNIVGVSIDKVEKEGSVRANYWLAEDPRGLTPKLGLCGAMLGTERGGLLAAILQLNLNSQIHVNAEAAKWREKMTSIRILDRVINWNQKKSEFYPPEEITLTLQLYVGLRGSVHKSTDKVLGGARVDLE
jgi:hypothetical protein